MFKCRSRNIHQKDICLKEIGLFFSNYVNYSRIDSQHTFGGGGGEGTYMTTYCNEHGNLQNVMHKVFVLVPRI